VFFNYKNLCLDIQLVANLDDSTVLDVEPPAPRKFTPQKKKKMVTRIKKTPTKKKATVDGR